ncbi:hypothetical protein EXA18_06695 [Vibrio cincinnatiensis]|uniref:hypothetical protein n=1 Tax=Vibrio cincinnatiensis TaxID=675 RepID=UPI001EDCBE99|nr:hypothetical protein [Vibrio cincinnatiensis]MCG3724722.1 hypothetical protein [Vibrio cincinnatiensis]MCG3743177.1 hypothetical protein [Vibrio cincinnatiensis]
MSELNLLDAVLKKPELDKGVSHLANQLKEKFWGEEVMPAELESYIIKAASLSITTDNQKAIYDDLEHFLFGQKQKQTLLQDRCL